MKVNINSKNTAKLAKGIGKDYPEQTIKNRRTDPLKMARARLYTNKPPRKTVTYKKAPKYASRALLIGINYIGTSARLNGCINDSFNLRSFLIKHKLFKSKEILMMNDKKQGTLYPSKKNIMDQFKNLDAQVIGISVDSVYSHRA